MSVEELEQILRILSDRGLGYFALYIVYHYTNQFLSTIVVIVLAKRILNMLEKWLTSYLEEKKG